MGNSPSTSQKQSPAGSQTQRHASRPARQEPIRRQSLGALSPTASKGTPAPPSANLESAIAQTTSISPSQARDIIRPTKSRDSGGSQPTSHSKKAQDRAMGVGSSKSEDKPRSASRKVSGASASPAALRTATAAQERTDDDEAIIDSSPLDPNASMAEPYSMPAASYSRPPRLPLAIEEEVVTPGSPLLSAVEPATDVPPLETSSQALNRRASVISSNIDEEEEPDEFQGYMPDVGQNVPKVPTVIEWREAQPHDKIYVTGTFADWERKYRLHWNGPAKHPDTVSATLQLPPGTHHVKFLVNNDMQVASHLPTTVDYTNILVNYIEVAANKTAGTPVAVPTAAPSKPLDIRTKQAAETASPSQRSKSSPAQKPSGTTSRSQTPAESSPRPTKTAPTQTLLRKRSIKKYTNEIPAFLLDLDVWPPPEESPGSSPDSSSMASKYRRATKVATTLPEPPSLPLFLNKSILNQAMPMKDDASVLVLPNHTVLNHLSTTNIKNGVLATSCTSRYKQRFLTTILYKPRSDDD